MTIGLISDTHSYLGDDTLKHLKDCDEIWHAGDIGNLDIFQQIKHKTIRGVYGNIDSHEIRKEFPENNLFEIHGSKFLIRHICGSAGKYNTETRLLLKTHKPKVIIAGHSHILRVEFFQNYNVLHLNPGAVGRHGFHQKRTLLKFEINENGELKNMRVVDLGSRSKNQS